MKKLAKLIKPLQSKRIGAEEYTEHRTGTLCWYERSGACLGEFLIWFGNRRYTKVDAKDLRDFVRDI